MSPVSFYLNRLSLRSRPALIGIRLLLCLRILVYVVDGYRLELRRSLEPGDAEFLICRATHNRQARALISSAFWTQRAGHGLNIGHIYLSHYPYPKYLRPGSREHPLFSLSGSKVEFKFSLCWSPFVRC